MFLFWNRSDGLGNYVQRSVRGRLDEEFRQKLDTIHLSALKSGIVQKEDLKEAYHRLDEVERNVNAWYILSVVLFILLATPICFTLLTFLLGVRCFLPNNYLVWEATRPISDCNFCRGINSPIILANLSREDFAPYAYSSQPIVIKQAVAHWPAMKMLNFSYLKDLYEKTPGALDESCNFMHFRSNFKTLRDVFSHMPKDVAWYVGWSNCHPAVLQKLRQLYPRPHFLPPDAEMPNMDYIFLGSEQGAFMHLNYMPRLLWQAQLQGNKSIIVAPVPECDHVCHSFSFNIESGDAGLLLTNLIKDEIFKHMAITVLVDPRIWYHGTSVAKNQFALTIQSEYG